MWSNLTKGEPHFTLSQVARNGTIMGFAFAPGVGLLLGLFGFNRSRGWYERGLQPGKARKPA